jgi:hypothetical protein
MSLFFYKKYQVTGIRIMEPIHYEDTTVSTRTWQIVKIIVATVITVVTAIFEGVK